MLNSEPQAYVITPETCKFLSFCLILLKFLMFEHYIRNVHPPSPVTPLNTGVFL